MVLNFKFLRLDKRTYLKKFSFLFCTANLVILYISIRLVGVNAWNFILNMRKRREKERSREKQKYGLRSITGQLLMYGERKRDGGKIRDDRETVRARERERER